MRTAQIGPDLRLTHFRLTYVAQKCRCLNSLITIVTHLALAWHASKLPEVNSEWHAKGDTRMRARKEKTEQLFFFLPLAALLVMRAGLGYMFFFVLLTCFHPFGTCSTFCHVSSLPLTVALLGNLFLTHATPCRWE